MRFAELAKKVKKSVSALTVTALLLTGVTSSVYAEEKNPPPKVVQILDFGYYGYPLVLDDQGNVWGMSISSLAYRKNLLPKRANFVKVENMSNVVSISGGRYGAAIKEDGTMWAIEFTDLTKDYNEKWGIYAPAHITKVPGLKNIVHTRGPGTAVDRDGRLWLWKSISEHTKKLLDWEKYFTEEKEPSVVKGLDGVKDLLATMILKEDGTVWNWKWEPRNGSFIDMIRTTSPVQIEELSDIVKLSGAGTTYNYAALKKDGTVWIWGGGKLSPPEHQGYGKPVVPTQVEGLSDIVDVSISENHLLALKEDGTVWSMGYFPRKAEHLFASNYEEPDNYRPPHQVEGLTDVGAVYTHNKTSAVIKKDGTLWMWGLDMHGLFGPTDFSIQPTPVQVLLRPDL
ncbi:hypothetical protein PV433_33945 [Paenibacillus sp. GYB004]|uniref:RCC1 domain-containing protein n=1 Tax=Paenibacillus sp. GYB004 TaxID=2994393 RepID=UPI002F96DF4E